MSTTMTAEAIIRAVDQFSGPVRAMANSLDVLAARSRQAVQSIAERTAQFATVGTGAFALMLPGIVGAINQYAEFEERIVKVRKVFDGSAEEFRRLSDEIVRMQALMPVLNKDLAILAEKGVQGGIKGVDEILDFVRLGAEFVKAFDVSAEAAGKSLATMKTQLNLTLPELRAFADAINYLGNETNTLEKDLLAFVARAGGSISAFSASAREGLLALGSTLLSMGTEWTSAEVAVRNAIQRLGAGEAAAKPVREALAKLGLEASAVAKRLNEDFGGTFLDIMERVAKLAPELRQATLNELFGSYAAAHLGKVAGNTAEFARQLALAADKGKQANSVAREFEKSIDTLRSKITQLNNQLSYLSNLFVEQFYPQIKSMMDGLGAFIKWMGEQPPLAKQFVLFGTVLIALAPLIAVVVGGLAALVAAFSFLGAVVVGLIGVPAAALAGLAAGIAGIYLALQFAAQHSKEFAGTLVDLGKAGGDMLAGWLRSAQQFFHFLHNGLASGLGQVLAFFEKVRNAINLGMEALGKRIVQEVVDGITAFWRGLENIFKGLFDRLFGGFKWLGDWRRLEPGDQGYTPGKGGFGHRPSLDADRARRGMPPAGAPPEPTPVDPGRAFTAPPGTLDAAPPAAGPTAAPAPRPPAQAIPRLDVSPETFRLRIDDLNKNIERWELFIKNADAALERMAQSSESFERGSAAWKRQIKEYQDLHEAFVKARVDLEIAKKERAELIRYSSPAAGPPVNVEGKVTGKIELDARIKVDGGRVDGEPRIRGGEVSGTLSTGKSLPDAGVPKP